MPVKPTGSETEQEFISRCMGEEKSSFPDNNQRYAVCKSKWDTQNMSVDLDEHGKNEIDALPEPNKGEEREKYIMRCIPSIYHTGGDYDQRTAISMCSSKYENSQEQLGGPRHMKSAFERQLEQAQFNLAEVQLKRDGIDLADYPWDTCIADQTEKYGDEETAKKVCGYIKSKYGSGAPGRE
jgi:hypothetical protein